MICKKYILIIIILAVVFLPQCFVYASDTEITDKIEQQMLEKIDMSEIEKYYKCAVLYDTFYGVFKAYFLAAGLCIQCKLSVYVCIGYINAYGIFFCVV